MTASAISLQTPVPSDFETLARIEAAAFQGEEFTLVAIGPSSEAGIAERAQSLLNASRPGVTRKYVKAVRTGEDGREEIVGWAQWWRGVDKALSVKEKEEKEKAYSQMACPRLCVDALVRGDEHMERACGEKEYLKLGLLVVSPEAQRRGIGALLLEDGLREADAAGLQVVLGASSAGEPLYKKYGFVVFEPMTFNLWEYEGGEGMGVARHTIMHRPAKPRV